MRVLATVAVLGLAACSSSSTTSSSSSSGSPGSSGTSGSPTGSSGSSGSSTFSCTLGARGAASLTTTYGCPDQASYGKCTNGDSTGCTPSDKKAGTVPIGGNCEKAFVDGDPGSEYELADNCAPDPKFGGQQAGKGAFCAFGYCTHACAQPSDCTDLSSTATCNDLGDCVK